jgi:PAS domain S-box-containing protein
VSQSSTSGRKQSSHRSATRKITASGLLQFLDISPDALLVIDRTGTIMMVNEQTEALFGYARSLLLGQQLEILLPEHFRAAHIAHREHYFTAPRTRLMATGLSLSGKRKDGSEFSLDISLQPLMIDKALCVIAAMRDMTEQKRKEEELHRLASIIESSGEAILSKTLGGVITSWNSSAEKLYGYRAEEAIGQSVLLLFPPEHQQEFEEILAQVARGKIVRDHETTRVRKDGAHIPVLVTISPIPDHRGRIIGASTIARDISEQKRMIREFASGATRGSPHNLPRF